MIPIILFLVSAIFFFMGKVSYGLITTATAFICMFAYWLTVRKDERWIEYRKTSKALWRKRWIKVLIKLRKKFSFKLKVDLPPPGTPPGK